MPVATAIVATYYSRVHEDPSTSTASLAQDLGKTGGFDSLEQEVFINLIRAHETLTDPFVKAFKAAGISMPLYNILRILRGHGARVGEGKGLAIQRIGDQMLTREPDMTRLIDRLERVSLAERRRCPEDRRVVHVEITAEGLALLGELDEPIRALHKSSMSHISKTELGALNDMLFRARGVDESPGRDSKKC